jgi:hypothetical protein
MSANQSNLSNARYGYDFVVATTQKSVNATMKEYLYNTVFPVVKMYWNQDDNGNPVPVSYDDLMVQTKNTDPLTVASWKTGDPMSQDITNINNSNFFFAFEAAIGIPSGIGPQSIPDIVTLQLASQSVIFNLICAQFTVVSCNFGKHGLMSFLNVTQPDDKPWLFTSTVALKSIFDNTNLPQNVQDQLNNFGPDAFSVQQLFFDLDNAALESTPTITGLDPGTPAYNIITQVFLGAYFKAMKASGQPVLNYSILQTSGIDNSQSTLTITDIELAVSPYINPSTNLADSNPLNTLNYLCEANGHPRLPVVPFTWNWVEQAEQSTFNGVIAINRNTFAGYYRDLLLPIVSRSCLLPTTSVEAHMMGSLTTSCSLTPWQTPQSAVINPTGATVLTISYAAEANNNDKSGLTYGEFDLHTSYSCNVSVSGSTITIVQRLVVYLFVQFDYTSASGNVVDTTITDTYVLSVGQDGSITSTFTTATADNHENPDFGWFMKLISNFQDIVENVKSYAQNVASASIKDIPVQNIQSFVFPGGKTFAFKDVTFSDNQDLVSHITYAQPKYL